VYNKKYNNNNGEINEYNVQTIKETRANGRRTAQTKKEARQ